MSEFLSKLFFSDFMGHGYCYRWQPVIMWLHAVSDGIIALTYYFIPLILVYLVAADVFHGDAIWYFTYVPNILILRARSWPGML